jgi:septin 7
MTFDLVHQVKSRARSLQLDKSTLSPAVVALEQVASQAQSTKRLSSLSSNGQTATVSFPVPAFVPATIRRYRSMLEVEEPPKLGPWNPMSFEELYATPLQSSMGSDDYDPSSIQSTRSCSENTSLPATVDCRGAELSSQKPTDSRLLPCHAQLCTMIAEFKANNSFI